ncbi:MAG TPA: histidinol-phosphatase [Pyrinomonadaceae bacterium]|jgi:histidinol phosphatase-like enzyme (inositol monophosphatase family)|nr:histidinol-phosphatase [Pyrinomonadaceae bacterium]
MIRRRDDSQALLDFAVDLAHGAGEITLHYFRKGVEAARKADGSFVTVADREAERYLRSALEKSFPDDAILGEEEGESSGSSGRRWIIDPIDGTYSFVHGVPLYGVLIGLEIDQQPALGVVNIPALGDLVYAGRGTGCFWNGERTSTSRTSTLDDALLLATDFGTCANYAFGEAAVRLQERVRARRTWGDCYGHVLVATGRADVMLDPVMNVWDCAALLPIIEESGGTFTDWHGQRTIYGGNAISTNGILLDEVMSVIGGTKR